MWWLFLPTLTSSPCLYLGEKPVVSVFQIRKKKTVTKNSISPRGPDRNSCQLLLQSAMQKREAVPSPLPSLALSGPQGSQAAGDQRLANGRSPGLLGPQSDRRLRVRSVLSHGCRGPCGSGPGGEQVGPKPTCARCCPSTAAA